MKSECQAWGSLAQLSKGCPAFLGVSPLSCVPCWKMSCLKSPAFLFCKIRLPTRCWFTQARESKKCPELRPSNGSWEKQTRSACLRALPIPPIFLISLGHSLLSHLHLLLSKTRQFNSKYLKLLREKSCYSSSSDSLGTTREVTFSNFTVSCFRF